MSLRSFAALSLMFALAACDDDDDGITGVGTRAQVRFVNATNTAVDFAINGVVAGGSGNLAFGGATPCANVTALAPRITILNAGTTTTIPGFALSLLPGAAYTIIATTNGAGNTEFIAARSDNLEQASGQAGVVGVNAVAGAQNFDLHVTAPGAALGAPSASNLAFDTPSSLFDSPPGTRQFRFTNTGTTTIAANAGNATLVAGANHVAVIGPPVTGGSALRAFVVAAC